MIQTTQSHSNLMDHYDIDTASYNTMISADSVQVYTHTRRGK